MTSSVISMKRKVLAIKRKLRQAWPDIPEAQLMLACVENVIEDALLPAREPAKGAKPWRTWDDKLSAISYLQGEMWHAELCGIDSDWVREVIYAVTHYKHDSNRKRTKARRKSTG